MNLLWIIFAVCSVCGNSLHHARTVPVDLSNLWERVEMNPEYFTNFQVSSSVDFGCFNGNQSTSVNEKCKLTPYFCPETSCCLAHNVCGCWDKLTNRCRGMESYRVKLSECTADGLKVYSDYQISLAMRQNGQADGLCEDINGEDAAKVEIIEEGVPGIRISSKQCWKSRELKDWTILVGYGVRIEDPDGWLIQKFLFRILQNVDIGSLMNDYKTSYLTRDNTESDRLAKAFSNILQLFDNKCRKQEQSLKWGCTPEPPEIFLDAGFLPVALVNLPQSTSNAGTPKFNTRWDIRSDGFVINSNVEDLIFSSVDSCRKALDWDEDAASVLLKQNNEDWSLEVTTGQCIRLRSSGKQLGQLSSVRVSEETFYKSFLSTARKHLLKQNQSDKNDF